MNHDCLTADATDCTIHERAGDRDVGKVRQHFVAKGLAPRLHHESDTNIMKCAFCDIGNNVNPGTSCTPTCFSTLPPRVSQVTDPQRSHSKMRNDTAASGEFRINLPPDVLAEMRRQTGSPRSRHASGWLLVRACSAA